MDDSRFAGGAAYIAGRYMPMGEATIPVTDWGFTRSDVVYDVVHVWKGAFFRLADHLDRFEASMAKRRLRIGEDREGIAAVLHRCVALAGLPDAFVAMVATRGRPRIFGSRRPADCDNYLIAYAIPWIDVIPTDVQARGAHLWIGSVPRVPDASVDPTIKNYQWSDLTSNLLEAHDESYDTAVTCDAAGLVTEGPGFNIFVVKDGEIATPGHGSLLGITRKTVLEVCDSLGLPVRVGAVTRAELEEADEVFLSSTAGGVMPVSRVMGHIMGNDRPGPVFQRVHDTYWAWHADPRYATPVRR
ncbi:MAG: aminotransferase class IV [Alphaproteobacteria bacterium]|nr:aminotransferase class IV [Alphaproteobacteria bacterium]